MASSAADGPQDLIGRASQPDFATALTTAIRARGMSLKRIAHHLERAGLPVSIATISYWQTGRSLPLRSGSEAVVEEMEKILGTTPGALMGPFARLHGEQWDPLGALRGHVDLGALHSAGLDIDRQVAVLGLHETVHVDRHWNHLVISRALIRGHHANLRRFAFLLPSLAAAAQAPQPHRLLGCIVEEAIQVAWDAATQTGMWAVPVTLPRALDPGELAAFEFRTAWHTTDRSPHRVLRPVPEPIRLLTLAARTSHPQPPTIRVTHHDSQTHRAFASAIGQHTEQHAPPGLYSLDWTMPLP